LDDTPEGRYIASLSGQHQNSHEIFPLIAAACIIATARNVPREIVDFWASAFTVTRVLYTVAFLRGASSVRPLLWVA
jgi:uncharacterized MAPEG superfamily protein